MAGRQNMHVSALIAVVSTLLPAMAAGAGIAPSSPDNQGRIMSGPEELIPASAKLGFARVNWIEGGTQAWSDAGHPVVP